MSAAAGSRREINGWSIRWDDALAGEARRQGWWLDRTIGEAARELAEHDPGRLIVIDGERRLTAGELYSDAVRLAAAMRRDGLQPGDVASFMLPNWHEACCVYLAASIAGLVVHPLVPAYRRAELSFMLKDCGSKVLFVPGRFRGFDYVGLMREVCAELATPPKVVVVRDDPGPFSAYPAYVASGSPNATFAPVDPDSVRMVLYTSGTTGRPKGVLHTHNTINADIAQIHRYWNNGGEARYLVASPVSHIGGSLYAFELPLLCGASAVLLDSWNPEIAVRLIEAHRCTHTAGATPFLEQILAASKAAGTRLESLKVFICGGASVPPSLVREASAWFANCAVSRVYGSTEVPTITIGSLAVGDLEHAAETDGRIGIAKVKLAGALEPGQEGEIFARGPQMLVGYLRPEDEQGAFDEDGFFNMGDLGRFVDGDYIAISGRKKEIIIRNGENISPKEVEDTLVLHPDILEVAVVGIPSEKTGELACAFIVPRPGARPSVQALAEYLAEQGIAKFKFPERVVLQDALVRNATGKVLKELLRSELLSGGSALKTTP